MDKFIEEHNKQVENLNKKIEERHGKSKLMVKICNAINGTHAEAKDV